MEQKERIERIKEMEKCLDEASEAIRELSEDEVFDLITDHEHLLERMEEASLYESAGED